MSCIQNSNCAITFSSTLPWKLLSQLHDIRFSIRKLMMITCWRFSLAIIVLTEIRVLTSDDFQVILRSQCSIVAGLIGTTARLGCTTLGFNKLAKATRLLFNCFGPLLPMSNDSNRNSSGGLVPQAVVSHDLLE